MSRTLLALLCASAVLSVSACGDSTSEPQAGTESTPTKVKVVLPWFIQGESAGHFVAKEKGFYEEVGLDVEILPGGPDVRHSTLLASGAVDFAVSSPANVLTSRGEGLPLVGLWAQNQEDGYQLVCKKEHGINDWTDLEGKRVGIWFGGAEYSVWYAMSLAGMERDDVELLPQRALSEFFEDQIHCASAMAWNEVHAILDEGYSRDELTFLKLSDLGKNLPGDSGVTTEKMIEEKPEVVQAFVTASLRGWQYALQNPEEAAEITVKYSPDLDLDAQVIQVEEVAKLMTTGPVVQSQTLGTQSVDSWVNVQTSLREAEQLKGDEPIENAFTNEFLDKVPAEYLAIDGISIAS